MNKKEESITVETTAPTTGAPNDIQEQIRLRAYELYEKRGSEDGHELEDWLQAEAEAAKSTEKAVATLVRR